MKRGGLIATIVVVVLVLAVLGQGCGTYNRLVTSRETVKQRWSQVDNQLQRRNDLITNLVETVRGVAKQELAVFGEIANARARMAGAQTPEQQLQAGRAMDSALGRLLVVIENYPQLRSSDLFRQLMDELAGTENRLATERMRYNQQVQDYNVMIQRFPTNLYAGMLNFHAATYYQIPDSARAVPRVDFNGIGKP